MGAHDADRTTERWWELDPPVDVVDVTEAVDLTSGDERAGAPVEGYATEWAIPDSA